MADKNMILSADAEEKLLKPIDEYVGKIQAQIDELRVDGSDKVRSLKNHIAIAKEDKNLSKEEKDSIIAKDKAALEKAKAVEAANKDKVAKLIADAEGYLKEHYDSEYYSKVVASCETEKAAENESYERVKATLKTEHEQTLAKLSDPEEIKDEKYVYKNKLFDAQMTHESRLQEIKDRKHDAFSHKYHLIDLLRMSKYTFMQSRAQKFENYKYTFNTTQFLYKNGLYIVIVLIFIALCIITPIVKNTQLLTVTNILNILQQASPRMFLALGVAGLILLTGTDLSIGRMVGMGMVTATIIMHNGANTGGVFGHIFDFSSMPVVGKALFALVACIILMPAGPEPTMMMLGMGQPPPSDAFFYSIHPFLKNFRDRVAKHRFFRTVLLRFAVSGSPHAQTRCRTGIFLRGSALFSFFRTPAAPAAHSTAYRPRR